MVRKSFAIFTLAGDFHAFVFQKALEDNYGARCAIVETDRICNRHALTWSNWAGYAPAFLTTDGERVDVRTLDLIWWRRSHVSQQIPDDVTEGASVDLINNDCRFALLGVLFNEFKGTWVSDPQATRYAQNKLVQIRVAERLGFRTPQTLVSQDINEIRDFCARMENHVVVKVVRGAKRAPLITTMLDPVAFEHSDSMRLCPAIYQELIPGRRHIRACCFGESVYAAMVESSDLDWRNNLNVPVTPLHLSAELKSKLLGVLSALGIKMGIFDLKFFGDSDEPVWLEVNPQGQFLFLEGLCGLPLIKGFSEFLHQQVTSRLSDAAPLSDAYHVGDRMQ